MSQFDLGGLNDMLGGLQQQLDSVKKEAAQTQAEGISGGGVVRVVASGDNQILSITIQDAAMDDRELLEDLVRAAANEALRKAQDESAAKLSALSENLLPKGLFGA